VRSDLPPEVRQAGFLRGHAQPHLLDWNRDGRTDLVLSDPLSWKLQVGLGPLTGKSEVEVEPYPLPIIPDAHPQHFEFADWDGDGSLDLLLAVCHRKSKEGPWLYEVHWFRNSSTRGEPRFEAPIRLLTIPEPWEVNGLATVHRVRDGRPDLAVSVTRNWQRRPDHGWSVESQLWLYRRGASPAALTRERTGGS
jgi:hypothetical protein